MAKQKISQEEVWDDSALVQSWNEALQEYKKYHSLAAKGEKVALVLDEAESGVPEKAPNTKVESKEEPELKAPNVNLEAEQQDAVGGAEAPQQQPQAEATVVGAGTMPQVLMNSGKSAYINTERWRRLLMRVQCKMKV